LGVIPKKLEKWRIFGVTEANDYLLEDYLSSDYRSPYRMLEQHLQEILVELAENPDWNLQPVLLSLKQMYQMHLLNCNLDGLLPQTAQMLQSVQVEIDKQLRLLGMDVQFLQAAKQPITVEQRKTQIRDRLQTLLRYCTLVLEDSKK
jgi:hypothetical protein